MRRKRMKSNLVSSGTIRSDGSQPKQADHRQHGDQDAESDENQIVSQPAPFPQIGTVCGRFHRTQVATISRVSVNAVNTVVMMPMPSVTAKPRTGPVPI